MGERKFRKSIGSIAFDDDIILAVSEKSGFTPKQVSNVFGAVFIDIKKQAKDPTTHAIRIPHVGNLLFKSEYARNILIRFDKYKAENPVSSRKKERMAVLKKQLANFDKRYEEKCAGEVCKSPHKYKSIMNLFSYRKYMTNEEFEQHINKHSKPGQHES